jgi:PmbA protein
MTMIVNSNGISLVDIGSKFICSVRSRVKEGVNIGNGYDYSISRKYSSLIPKRVSEKSAELSVTSIKKKMIPSGNYKIILDPHAFADLVKGLLIPAALGVNVQHKSSFLSERLGEIVAGSNFTLIDDGTLNSGINASYMDHEGTLTGKTKIIDNGMLTGWLYDYYSACKEHRESTGNGIRFLSPIFDKIYRFTPQAEGTNTILLPGSATRNELIEEVYDGILVSFLVGSWSFNYSNGTFSADARNCYRIEKGEISYAVDEATIHGNVIDLIKDLQIGNNSTQSRGCIPLTPAAVITPTVVAENVSIGA